MVAVRGKEKPPGRTSAIFARFEPSTMISVKSLQRYPVKGLSAEFLPYADLQPGQTLPNDRAFAVENGPSGFEPEAPSWMPKVKFLCWMKNPKLARVSSRYDDATGVLTLELEGGKVEG